MIRLHILRNVCRAAPIALGAAALALVACGPAPASKRSVAASIPSVPSVKAYATVKAWTLWSEFGANRCEDYAYRKDKADTDVAAAVDAMRADGLTEPQIDIVREQTLIRTTRSMLKLSTTNKGIADTEAFCSKLGDGGAEQFADGKYLVRVSG